jgi:aldose 1-epimerase
MSRPFHPSGAQHELRHGDQRAVVVEVGGALRAYDVAGEAVLDGYSAGEMCSGARGQTLAPWPNRLRDGRYRFDGAEQQLPLSEPERRNAIHGLLRWANWSAAEHDADRVVMAHRLHPQPGYPFALDLELDYRLDEAGLAVTIRAENTGEAPCPFGAGAHPYITAGTARVDEALLEAPGRRRLVTDDRGIPTGSEPVEGTPYDFRDRRRIGELELDTAFEDLARDDEGRAEVSLDGPDRRVTLWMDERYAYAMLFSGDSLTEPERRRRGLGVEPMTCAPNAFRTGDGLVTLDPGERFEAAWGIAARYFDSPPGGSG